MSSSMKFRSPFGFNLEKKGFFYNYGHFAKVRKTCRASRPLLGTTITRNLVPRVLKKIFPSELVKKYLSLQNGLLFHKMCLKNGLMPPMSKIGLDLFL